jgi:hypothetical protein
MAGPGGRPGLVPPDLWGPAGFRYHGHPVAPGNPWHPWYQGHPVAAGYRSREPEVTPTAADRAGRLAALSLLMLAMLIWLFTALLFARHGVYPPGPMGPAGHIHHFPPGP